jgi:hypothetical protein
MAKEEKEDIKNKVLALLSSKSSELIDTVMDTVINDRVNEENDSVDKVRTNSFVYISASFFKHFDYDVLNKSYFTQFIDVSAEDQNCNAALQIQLDNEYQKHLHTALELVRNNYYQSLTYNMVAALLIYVGYSGKVLSSDGKIYILDDKTVKEAAEEYKLNVEINPSTVVFIIRREDLDDMIMKSDNILSKTK